MILAVHQNCFLCLGVIQPVTPHFKLHPALDTLAEKILIASSLVNLEM
jgi:hypothetical protein